MMIELQLAVTLYLTGLIWFVQLVHYPMFSIVGEANFTRYEHTHQTRTGRAVAPAMLIEAAIAVYLVFSPASPWPPTAALAGALLLLVIWLSTFFLQVPCHRILQNGFDPVTCSRLVRTNWIRTIAWSLRGILLLAMLDT